MVKLKWWFTLFLIFSTSQILNAQLCNGTLGDPIINYTFPAGTDQLPTENTDFTNVMGCPGPGKYTINNFLFGCAQNTWFALTGDHTRDNKGNYFLVNGEDGTAKVFSVPVGKLCGNTTYQFAAWISNVMKSTTCNDNPVHPNITFKIETTGGAKLASYNTGDLFETQFREWNQYGVTFTIPTGIDSVILSITNTAKKGCGNSFALDDITLQACGPSVIISLDGKTEPFIDVCAGYSNPFTLSSLYSTSFRDPLFQWQKSIDKINWQDIPGATFSNYNIPRRDSGIVLYRMMIAERVNFNSIQCRITSKSIWTNIHKLPTHQPLKQLIGCQGKDLILKHPSNALTYQWTYPGGFTTNLPNPLIKNVQSSDTGIYKVTITEDFGCAITDSFNLKVYPSTTVVVDSFHQICYGKSINLAAKGQGIYQWSPSQGLSNDKIADPIASPTQSTDYKVLLTNLYGCQDSSYVKVIVNENVVASAGNDKQILAGDTVQLNATIKGTDFIYQWTPIVYMANSQTITPMVFPPKTMTYYLTASSLAGCGKTTSQVKIIVSNNIYIPNSFTPNDDGINDLFKLVTVENYKINKFNIYNRWGKMVYSTLSFDNGWDGKFKGIKQPEDIYIYQVKLQSLAGKEIYKQGTLMLIR